jgi:hypothetical protein
MESADKSTNPSSGKQHLISSRRACMVVAKSGARLLVGLGAK